MASSMEGIIRPFQQGDVFTARVLHPTAPAEELPADIEQDIGGPVQLINKPIGVTDLNSRSLHEVERRTSVTRVSNPEDENQYVDVERIDFLKLKDANGQEWDWTLNNT